MGAHDVASSGLYQSTKHQGNTDVKDIDDSHSFETPKKIITVIPLLVIHLPQQPHHVHPH